MTVSPWIQTYSGARFYPENPTFDSICIEDIAHSLSMKCRYGGHSRHFYSVAQHSVLVSRYCRPDHWLWGLMHDASEAYLVDLPRPIKPLVPGYVELEKRIQRVIARRFGMTDDEPAEVKAIDNRILVDEAKALMGGCDGWGFDYEPLGCVIEPWEPRFAREQFLARFDWITGGKEA